ncbi:ubiquitin fusion degradation protein (UFD1 homologue), putative [Theileria annulata]|uniref:Ubiquitin fusion degradation protein (UFD1 homologue), putative n=1 Tax=Theileria annulata TaxID=5874 RepID=Q4UEN1_THEAN|nr:ubiquitin fusion degradation protein (UFD1 homologue), putative [Theileria annulata]CAI74458.1 ubiquitin fusion degradation protein (UFD1 homologue), putative [Theileria annulata]|eukprot:XP_952190.1 ubiquitin fusion degradation protein (UFD1 homologue), putative [Theileria annulata]
MIQENNLLKNPYAHTSNYRCFSVSFAGRESMEQGNKSIFHSLIFSFSLILLPQSALHELASRNISWPMMFEILNPKNYKRTNGGVLEFISEEGTCNIPYWVIFYTIDLVMSNLGLNEGDIVTITNVSLPKANWVKLKPLNEDYWDISNPRAVLENALRNYATLTVGDVIPIHYIQTVYLFQIMDLKPAKACSIIETDMEVEFDMPAPEPKEEEKAMETDPEPVIGKRLDGKTPRLIKQNVDTVNKTPWKNKLPNGIRLIWLLVFHIVVEI